MIVEIFHVMPNDDKHTTSTDCWCEPYLSYKDDINDNEVYTHREIH